MEVLKNFNFKRLASVIFPLFLFFWFFYYFASSGRVLPNTYFAKEPLSGKNEKQVSEIVSKKIDSYEQSGLILEIEGGRLGLSWASLGFGFDERATIERAFGRSDGLRENLISKLVSPFVKTRVVPVHTVDFAKLASSLDQFLSTYEQRAIDASIVFEDGRGRISEDKLGRVVDRTRLIAEIRDRLENLSESPVKVTFVDDLPKVKSNQAQMALDKVALLGTARVILSFGYDSWRLEGKNLLELLRFFPQGYDLGYVFRFSSPWALVEVTDLALVDVRETLLEVGLDNDQMDTFIEKIAKTLDRPTIDATFRFEGVKIVDFTPAVDGQKLDKVLTRELVLEKVSIENASAENLNISLPVKVSNAKIANEQVNSLGIRELLGRGVSFFSGSIPNRVHNLSLGSSRVSGTLVAPEEIFSFNKTVGEVSAASGYRQAYVISEGRTVLDDGGGICQVSTTIFRATLAAGLPIVSRTAHAYRVAYYEQGGFKAGLDATVWAPAVDFQFKNDTSHYILVQAQVDRANMKLQVDIYGTSDGRKVEMTEPVVSNLKEPPADKYQDEPSLPRGTVKQVDFAAWGAAAVFRRKVHRGDKLMIDESFKSNFRPWQAVYLVGTGGT